MHRLCNLLWDVTDSYSVFIFKVAWGDLHTKGRHSIITFGFSNLVAHLNTSVVTIPKMMTLVQNLRGLNDISLLYLYLDMNIQDINVKACHSFCPAAAQGSEIHFSQLYILATDQDK